MDDLRHKARELALQALYEIDTATHHATDTVIRGRLIDDPLNDDTAEAFFRDLVFGVLRNRDMLDALITEMAPDWSIHELSVIDRNLLRLGTYELAAHEEIGTAIAISETVKLAYLYSTESMGRLVNGVLRTVSKRRKKIIKLLRNAAPSDQHPKSIDTASTN